jgi:hypothetical protein
MNSQNIASSTSGITMTKITFGTASLIAIAISFVLPTAKANANPHLCAISGTWDYQSPHSLVYRDRDFRPTNSPYSTTLQLTESNIQQSKGMEGSRSYMMQTSNLATLTQDSTIPAAQRSSQSTRIGKQISINFAVPVANAPYAGQIMLLGDIQKSCNTIKGKIYNPTNQNLSFTLTRSNSAATPNNSNTASISGKWVTFLGKPLDNYGSIDHITQTGNQLKLESGISGQTFSGSISGDTVKITLPATGPGKLSRDRNVVHFGDMAIVRLGSPTCPNVSTCKLP